MPSTPEEHYPESNVITITITVAVTFAAPQPSAPDDTQNSSRSAEITASSR